MRLFRGRGELLEAYLRTLFRPHEHKAATTRAADPERLRDALQDLAFTLLERGEIGAPDREVRRILAAHAAPSADAERLFDDAVRFGLLRYVTNTRLAFPFPIVQEYLAAQELVARFPDQISARAHRAVERPWAQMVQFALEQLPDASAIVREMLARPDDAFVTTTRLVARCVLNGMPCAPALREEIGDRLARAWPKQSYWTCRAIGQMLFDGWTRPLRPSLRAALHLRSLLTDGSAAILAASADPPLTLSVLRAFMRPGNYLAHLWEFQPTVSAVSAEAFEIYIEASRTIVQDRDWALAGLVSRLEPSAIPSARLAEVARDESVPRGTRLAAWSLQGREPDELYWRLAGEAFRSETASDHWPAVKALGRTPSATTHVRALLRNVDFSEQVRLAVIDHLHDVLSNPDLRFQFVVDEIESGDLPERLVFHLRFHAAQSGDRAAYDQQLAQLGSSDLEEIGSLILLLNHFGDRAHGDRLVAHLRSREMTGGEKVRVLADLMIAARHVAEVRSLGGGAALKAAPQHPSYPDFLALLVDWREDCAFEFADRLRLETIAARERVPGAIEALERLATQVVLDEDVRGYENPFNHTIQSAIEELARQGRSLAFPVAVRLVETSDSNAHLGALYHLAAIGTREALDYMIERHARDDEHRSILFGGIEALSARLGLRVVEDEGLLHVLDQATEG